VSGTTVGGRHRGGRQGTVGGRAPGDAGGNREDLRANQFLNMGHRFMLEGDDVDALELLGQRSLASELGECSN